MTTVAGVPPFHSGGTHASPSCSVARGAKHVNGHAVLARPVLLGRLSTSARLSARWWRQHRPATGGGPTPTGIPSLPLGWRPPPTPQLIIVGQFFARRDRAQGFKIHPLLLGHRFAVRCTRVIEIARLIAPHPRINDRPSIHGEQEDVRLLTAVIVIPCIGCRRGEPLAGIFDNPRPFADAPGSEGAKPLNGRRPNVKAKVAHATSSWIV
jgi:hypothetical protein